MVEWLDAIRSWLLPVLYGLAAAFGVLLAGLIVARCLQTWSAARRRRLIDRYRSAVDALLDPRGSPDAAARLAATPSQHRTLVGELIVDALRQTRGTIVARLAEASTALGLVDHWTRTLDDRRWWMRAEAARALGRIQHAGAVDALIALLDDPHEEVRAASVDALGNIGDHRAAAVLVARLPDQSRQQRARVFEALRQLGPSVAPVLLKYVDEHPQHTTLVIDVLGVCGATVAGDRLLTWTAAPDADVRAAALRSIGSIGLDDRSLYFALRGLEDDSAQVRAMAARALGRSGRDMTAPYLATHLADEWVVAAHAATGLRRLGSAGRAQLEPAAGAEGQAGVLARQMLWELDRVGARP